MESLNTVIEAINSVLFSEVVVFALLATGILFTVWSMFGQYRALTHGVSVVRGKFDDKDDPGAINHFQALSTALSATVGLGNIAGVALAVALGGPGAVLWMWVIGIVGMALKMTEVTQSMLYRNTDDPDNPHGGPMFVIRDGMARWGLKPLGTVLGGIFVVTLIMSAITGGNMFQAWSVANVTNTYFEIPQVATGIILALIVAAVIIGGIKRIGAVAGRLVPFMCVLYVLAALYVLFVNIADIPAMLALIVRSGLPEWLGGSAAEPTGAFLGGTFGYAAMWGIKRALFSSEAGQGSAPIAHSAAKTDEPVREGVVAGLEPFIDTIVVCTMTALVILSSGAYNRPPEAEFQPGEVQVVAAGEENKWTLETPALPRKTAEARRILRTEEGHSGWKTSDTVFMIVHADTDDNTGRDLRRVTGAIQQNDDSQWSVNWDTLESVKRPTLIDDEEGRDLGIYVDYAAASLTAHAFDRVAPGLGMWLVTLAAWLFAISTMISWSYYGEQGVYYLCGRLEQGTTYAIVLVYKIIYAGLILLTTIAAMPIIPQATGNPKPLIGTEAELDMWTTLGLGVMLVANIPIMLIFSKQAMDAYHNYFNRMKSGDLDPPHGAPSIPDVVEGKDVE